MAKPVILTGPVNLELTKSSLKNKKSSSILSISSTFFCFREIIRKRKHFGYKINGVTKNLQDFKDYIQYEKLLLRHIKLRRNKYRVADRKNSIEFSIIKRIKFLYEVALQRYSNDFSLYLSFFKFCKEYNYNRAGSLIQNMIKNFSHNPEVWQVAAAWYIRRDLHQALNVIHKGLTIHKDCQFLYSEAIQLELLNRDKDDWPKDTTVQKTNDEKCCEKIRTYVQTIFKNINDFKYLLKTLKLLEPYNFTQSVQNIIIERLLQYHIDEELVWDALAQREKNGHHYGITDASQAKSTKYCLSKCFQKYQEGLLKISKVKLPALWTLYLDCLMELQQESDVANVIKKNTLKTALEEASNQITLEERHFVVWVKLTDNEVDALKVLEKGIAALPESVELWNLRLRYAIMKDQTKEVNQVFKKAILNLKEKSVPLWLTTLRYHTLTSGNEVIDLIYKDGVEQPKEVSDILKPEYIQWVALMKGIKEARKIYNLVAQQKPYCKELHATMFKIESLEMEQDVDEMENILKLACDQFGKDVDVWVNYAEFYLEYHKLIQDRYPSIDINEKIFEIRRMAENTLRQVNDGLLLPDLREKFDFIKSQADI